MADVARDALEARVQQQDADGHAVQGTGARHGAQSTKQLQCSKAAGTGLPSWANFLRLISAA